MELLERYLMEVGRHLPRKDRDDILAELRSLIQDQLDERAADRPDGKPTEADLDALLREFGAPRRVAASYAGDRYLVGPTLYPTMMTVLRIGLIVTTVLFALSLLGSMGSASTGMLEFFLGSIAGFIQSMLAFFGIVVLIFALLEASDVELKTLDARPWDPQTLPAADNPARAQRFELIVGIAFNLIFLVLLNYFRQVGGLTYVINPSDPGLVVPVAAGLLIALMGIVFAQVATDAYVFQVGHWQLGTQLIHAALDLASLFVSYQIFLQFVHGVAPLLPADLQVIIPGDQIFGLIFTLALAGVLIGNGIKLVKLIFYRPSPPSVISTPAREG